MADDSDQNQDDARGHERPEREQEAPANNVGLIPLGNQGALADPALTDPSMDGAQPGAPPSYPDSLLGNPHLSGRGNSPVREAIVQRWQQTYGNRATQRMLQRFKEGAGPSESDDLAQRIQSKSGSGNSLDPAARVQLESTLGADMSNVQVHTDSEAHRMAQSVDAVAFTTGNDIFFREGAYNPGSSDGMKLLAHEATHTVQQSQGPVSGTPVDGGVSVSDPSDSYEQEASRVAEAVTAAPSQAAQTAAPAASNAVHAQRTHAHKEDEEQDSSLPLQAYRPSPPAVQREAAPSGERDEEQQLIPEAEEPVQRQIAGSASFVTVQRDGAGAPAKKSKGTTTINPVVPKTYKVTGKTLQEAVDDIGQRDEAGETTWEPKLKYDLDDNGNVKSATITVTITVTMPNWPDAAKLNKAAKAEWDRFMKALQKHEDGHVKVAKDKFKDSADRLIGKSEADAQAEFEKIKQEVQDASDAYDSGNDHGQKEGTIVDVDAGAPAPKAPAPAPGTESTSSSTEPEASGSPEPEYDETPTAVQTFVQRQPSVGKGAGWSDADTGTYSHPATPDNPATPAGGWNAGNQTVGKVERIPIDGLTSVGNQDAAMGTPGDPAPTGENATGKAIVCVPDNIGTNKNPEVLLHLHGFNVGYRERNTAKPGVAGMEAGTVRDVSVDRIEAQLQASGRPMVAILPQGTMTSGFGDLSKNSNAYISEIFSRLVAMQKLPAGASPGRVVVSGHSGAGAPISQMLAAGTLPANTGELALFDAINGTGQLTIVQNWLLNGKTGQMPQDLAALKKIAADGQAAGGSADDIKQAQLTYLSTSMRFIAFYSPKYPDIDPATKQPRTDAKGNVIMKGYGVVHEALNAAMEAWKNANLKGLAPEVVKAFRDNYQVLPAGHGDHEKMVGNKDALLKALSVLPPAPPAPAPPPSSSSSTGAPGGQGQQQPGGSTNTPGGDGPSDAGAGDAGKDTGDLGGTSLPGGVSDASGAKDDQPATVQAMRVSSYSSYSGTAVQRKTISISSAQAVISGQSSPVPVQREFKKQTYKLSTTKIPVVKADPKKKMAEIDESPADYASAILKKAGLKPEDWFKSFTTTTFLGRSIGEPIHTDLAAHLKDVEKTFAEKYGGDDKSPAKAGDALGLSHESIAGGREAPTSAVFSMHLFGLAVDLNYTANPFISASANPVFNRAGLLVSGTAAAWKPNMSYDDLSALDKTLETYFSYLDKPDDLKARLDASTAAPWKGMSPDRAKKQIQDDLDLVAKKWERSDASKKATIKAGGFMDLKKELVEGIGLNWGASYGDMMHFDMRNKGNGAKIEAAIGQYKAEKEKESKEAYKKEQGEEAMAEEGASENALALNEESDESEDAAQGETGAGTAAEQPQTVQAKRASPGRPLVSGIGRGQARTGAQVQRVPVSSPDVAAQRQGSRRELPLPTGKGAGGMG